MKYSLFYDDFMGDFNEEVYHNEDDDQFVSEREIVKGFNYLFELGKIEDNPQIVIRWDNNKSLLMKFSFKKIFNNTKNLIEVIEISAESSTNDVIYVEDLNVFKVNKVVPSVLKCIFLCVLYKGLIKEYIKGMLKEVSDENKDSSQNMLENFINKYVNLQKTDEILINL